MRIDTENCMSCGQCVDNCKIGARSKNLDYHREQSRKTSKRYREKIAQYNQQQREYYHTHKRQLKQFEYCRQQKGVNDLGCLDCKLPECIQLEDRADEIKFQSGYEERYNEIKEKTWLSVDFKQEFEEGEEWWRAPIIRHNKRSKK